MSLSARLEYARTLLAQRPVAIAAAEEAILAAMREAEKLETDLAAARASNGVARAELGPAPWPSEWVTKFPPLEGDA